MAYPKIVSKDNQILAYLNNIEECTLHEKINGEYTFSFVAIIEELKTEFLYNLENLIEVCNDWFIPLIIEEIHSQDGLLTVRVDCEHYSYKLLDYKFLEGFKYIGITATQAMAKCLEATPFQFAGTDVTLKTDIQYETETNAREILVAIANDWKGELKTRKNQVFLWKKRGEQRGVEFRFGKNINSVKRTIDRSKKDLENKPSISYEIDILDLREFDDYKELEYFELGDSVFVYDEALNISLRARIIEVEYNPVLNINTKVTLGNLVEDIRGSLSGIGEAKKKVEEVKQTLKENIPIWDKIKEITNNLGNVITEKLQGNINTAKNMVLNSTGTVKFTDQGILIHDQPSESNSSWAMRLNSTGFAIANGKNADGSWNFRTFGTGKGFTADEITAGTLEAIVIKGVNILASSISGGKIEGVNIEGSTIYAGSKASGNYTAITQNGEIRIYEKGKRVVAFWKSNNGGYLFLNTADGLDAVRIQPLDANTGGLDLSSWNGSNLGKTRILSRGMDLHCSLKSEGINIINANTFVQGDFQVTGAKNALVHTTEFGDRLMYAYEGTRSKFFDEGVGFLKDGICEIHLNPMFLSTIEPLDKSRYQVQLTPFETSLNLYVERLEHDKVRIRSDTQKEGKFFWHISGIRKGYADEFMKQVLGKEEYAPRDIQIQRKIENMKG